jgi:hypothetical protein
MAWVGEAASARTLKSDLFPRLVEAQHTATSDAASEVQAASWCKPISCADHTLPNTRSMPVSLKLQKRL